MTSELEMLRACDLDQLRQSLVERRRALPAHDESLDACGLRPADVPPHHQSLVAGVSTQQRDSRSSPGSTRWDRTRCSSRRRRGVGLVGAAAAAPAGEGAVNPDAMASSVAASTRLPTKRDTQRLGVVTAPNSHGPIDQRPGAPVRHQGPSWIPRALTSPGRPARAAREALHGGARGAGVSPGASSASSQYAAATRPAARRRFVRHGTPRAAPRVGEARTQIPRAPRHPMSRMCQWGSNAHPENTARLLPNSSAQSATGVPLHRPTRLDIGCSPRDEDGT